MQRKLLVAINNKLWVNYLHIGFRGRNSIIKFKQLRKTMPVCDNNIV